ncbi:MAG TPA: metallopeptidase family protein [Polyangia bacterium]|jgi:predicted Zn-dependent protease with MMP-like domain
MTTDDIEQGMDELTAHLDRAWDLLDRGELRGAERSARQALLNEPGSAEAYTILGIVALNDGLVEKALERFEHAIELDPEYVEPYLHAAETHLYQGDNDKEALRLTEEALDHAEEEEEYLDALLLKAEILLSRQDEVSDAAARKTLAELPDALPDDPAILLRAGHAFLELDNPKAAERHYQAAAALEPDSPDGWYGLGLCAEARNDERLKVKHWLHVRELDLKADDPPWTIPEAEFESIAEQALEELPPIARDKLVNVPILASDYPAADIVKDGMDPRMLGFFAGVPYPEKSSMGGPAHLDCIFLYKRNIERVAQSPEDVREEIRITLLHETGHFFALDEEELEALGLG